MKTTLGLPALKYTEDVTCKSDIHTILPQILMAYLDYIARLIIWNETEKWVVLIVGCIPPIRPLFISIFRKIATSTRSKTTSGRTNETSRNTELRAYSHGSKNHPHARHISPSLSTAQGSEENILAMEDGAIMKTTDISLTYESGSLHRGVSEPGGYVTPTERV